MEFEWWKKKKKDRGTFPQLLEQKSTTWIDMHHRGVLPRVIIIIVLRTLQTIVVRKCQSSRSHADQMLHLALWCCRDVDRPQRFTRWSNAIHSAVHTRIQWTLFQYVYIYIYPDDVSSWWKRLFIDSAKCNFELCTRQITRWFGTLVLYICLYLYLHVSEDVYS
jgi:hypothetical protein